MDSNINGYVSSFSAQVIVPGLKKYVTMYSRPSFVVIFLASDLHEVGGHGLVGSRERNTNGFCL